MKRDARSLRLLMTAYDYRPRLGGVATVGFELARALAERPGNEVLLLAPDMPGAREFDAASGVPTERIALPGGAAAAIAPIAYRLARATARWRPDAILSLLWMPEGCASLLCAPVRAAMGGVPYYTFVHGVEVIETWSNLKKKLRASLAPAKRAVISGASGVFTGSRFARSLVVDCCDAAPDRVHAVAYGVDPDRFAPGPIPADLMERHGLQGRQVFLTVSRFQEYKGVDRAIAAFRHVAAAHPEASYLICGEGEDRPRLESLVRHYRLQGRVIFAGTPSFERLPDYYRLADAFVLVPRSIWEEPQVEGFGLVFLEAAACGKPSIGGASGGVGDAIGNGRTGWLVDPHDDRAIAAAMSEALSDPERTRRLGEAARSRILEYFTWDLMAGRVADVIATGLKERARVRD